MQDTYANTTTEQLSKWFIKAAELSQYWKARMQMWQDGVIQQVSAGMPDDVIDAYLSGYWDACELFYRYSFQAYEMDKTPSGMVRYGAPEGMHDDCVMSLALAWAATGSAGSYSISEY